MNFMSHQIMQSTLLNLVMTCELVIKELWLSQTRKGEYRLSVNGMSIRIIVGFGDWQGVPFLRILIKNLGKDGDDKEEEEINYKR